MALRVSNPSRTTNIRICAGLDALGDDLASEPGEQGIQITQEMYAATLSPPMRQRHAEFGVVRQHTERSPHAISPFTDIIYCDAMAFFDVIAKNGDGV